MQVLPKRLFNGSLAHPSLDTQVADTQAKKGLAALKAANVATPKDLAAQKLEDAKTEIEFLKRWGFPPKIVAQRAGELLRTVGAAASDFAQAAGTQASAAPQGSAVSPNPLTLSGESDLDTGQIETGLSADGRDDDAKDAVVRIPQEYQAVMNDSQPGLFISPADQISLAEFGAVADELRRLQAQSQQSR